MTAEEQALWTAQLANAEAALDELLLGDKAVSAGEGGRSGTLQATSEGKLRARILELKVKLGLSTGARARSAWFGG